MEHGSLHSGLPMDHSALLNPKPHPILHSTITLKLPQRTTITLFNILKSHWTMAPSLAHYSTSSNRKSITPAAKKSHSMKGKNACDATPKEGIVVSRVKHQWKAKPTSFNPSPHPTAELATLISKGNSILPPSSSHSMMRCSQCNNGVSLSLLLDLLCIIHHCAKAVLNVNR